MAMAQSHKKTSLIWQRCALGQTWAGTNCSGTANTYNYAQAKVLTVNFAGQSFSPFDNLTANTQRNATLTIKASTNGVATDKVINLTGIGRAQVANVFDNDSTLRGRSAWGVSELKVGNPPINTQLVARSLFMTVQNIGMAEC